MSGKSARADVKAAEEFFETLDKLIVEENYLSEQIFNMDKTFLLLKGFSSRMRSSQCQVSRLLGTGKESCLGPCCRLQIVIWCSENPRAFKHISKHTLLVYYRSNKKSWMTQLLSRKASLNCYASEMEKYGLLLIMLLDILPLLVIFIPI